MITARTLLGSLLTVCLSLLAVAVGALSANGLDGTATPPAQGAGASGAGIADAGVQSDAVPSDGEATAAVPPYKPKSKVELRRSLTALQYRVTQEAATEPAFANRYWNNKQAGTYHCIVCGLPLFASLTKFHSGTGWPSFYAPLSPDRIGTKRDWKMVIPRIEVHCHRCGAHLGHVFSDGPPPTGKRFCLNSASLNFVAAGEDAAPASPAPQPLASPEQTAAALAAPAE